MNGYPSRRCTPPNAGHTLLLEPSSDINKYPQYGIDFTASDLAKMASCHSEIQQIQKRRKENQQRNLH